LLRFLNLLSILFGVFATIKYPKFVANTSIKVFIKLTGAIPEEAELSLDKYPNLNSFFTRNLRSGIRPIGISPISPVDGFFRSTSTITQGLVEQVKGKNYSVKELLGEWYSDRYEGGKLLSFYLSPKDYHHIHAPVSGKIKEVYHLPGYLWPVNTFSLKNISHLFSRNERVIVRLINEEFGEVLLILVGATNVGSISIDGLLHLGSISNKIKLRKPTVYTLPNLLEVKLGTRIGTFNLGSTVLLVTPKNSLIKSNLVNFGLIKYGQSLIVL
jgi:phosphatidylserine decarboxylase